MIGLTWQPFIVLIFQLNDQTLAASLIFCD